MTNLSITPWLLDRIMTGESVLFLGAGATRGAIGPNGEIALDSEQLRDKIADEFLGGQQKKKSLIQVADYAKNEAGLNEVQSFIRRLFEGLNPAEFHMLIPSFRWHAIITTNYDLILEKAYDNHKEKLQYLAKIIRDGDNFSEKIKDPDSVPYLKLHGCISVINDEGLPLILGSEEYAKHRRNRERLFDHFNDWGRDHVIIFCGYDIGDPNIQQILFDLSDMGINRPPYAVVSPSLNEFDLRMWQARRFTVIKATFEEFLKYIDSKIPKTKRMLSMYFKKQKTSISKYIATSAKPSKELIRYLECELEHVYVGMPTIGVKPKDFYRGKNDSWGPYLQELDIKRRVSDDLILDPILEENTEFVRVVLLKGHAGSGKSAVLRRVAWDGVNEFDAIVFWLKEGGVIRPNLIRDIYNLLDKRITIIIEDAMRDKDDIIKLIHFANKNRIQINIIIGARTNEWNIYGEEIMPKVNKDFEVRNLSEKEITDLLGKLSKHKCLGEMKNKSHEERLAYFKLTADRQLLVALHEATYGKPFEEILLDEYKNISPLEAQILYLDICTLNRLGVGVRAGLISRVSEIRFEQFKERLFKPLDHVVRTNYSYKERDYLYQTRHPIIAGIVFNMVLNKQKDRADQMIRMIRYMNVDYEADELAFSEMIKGRTIAKLFSNRNFADQLYKAASESTAPKYYIEHQKAVFEIHHPNGDLNKASQAIKAAEANIDGMNNSIAHTKSIILREMAQKAKNQIEKEKYRKDAKEILFTLTKNTNVAHPIHTLAEIYIDELKDRIEQLREKGEDKLDAIEQRAIFELVKRTEETIQVGLHMYPDDQFLLTSDSKLAKLLRDESRAYKILENAFDANPRNGYIAVRLSRYYASIGQKENSVSILERCLDDNPTCREAHLELAIRLIEENEESYKEKINRHLRSSFTDGDTNYEAQYRCARHNFIYGDRQRAYSLFETLKSTRLPPAVHNKIRGKIKDSQGNLRNYHGSVRTLSDTFCFAACAELNVDIFIHYTYLIEDVWDRITTQTPLIFNVAFNLRGPIGINARVSTVIE